MLDVAIDAAKQAGQLALKQNKHLPKVSYKEDNSPVTKADIEAEKLIRKIITNNYPNHGIIGEELPTTNPKAKYKWLIDPIDGTSDYVRQIPFWATMIGILENLESPLSKAQTLSPSSLGSIRSRTIRSGFSLRALFRASKPSYAAITS